MEKRQKSIMIQIWTSINPDIELDLLQKFRPGISSKNMLFRELELKLYNGILYASDNVLKKSRNFISARNYQAYLIVFFLPDKIYIGLNPIWSKNC